MTADPDTAWLGLERIGDGRWAFELTEPLSRLDGKLYGGTGIAAAIATMESETNRRTLWVTTQFVRSADIGERIEYQVDVLAAGKRTSQVRLTATVGDRIVVTALGAAGEARTGPLETPLHRMPEVPGPQEGEEWTARWHPEGVRTGWLLLAEMRQVEIDGGRYATWGRMRDGAHSRASIAFLADLVPSSVARAAGVMGGGTSLDNSIRFGRFVESEWLLLEFDPWLATGGYLHGAARVWAEDGTLLGVASQTATTMVWSGESPPWLNR